MCSVYHHFLTRKEAALFIRTTGGSVAAVPPLFRAVVRCLTKLEAAVLRTKWI